MNKYHNIMVMDLDNAFYRSMMSQVSPALLQLKEWGWSGVRDDKTGNIIFFDELSNAVGIHTEVNISNCTITVPNGFAVPPIKKPIEFERLTKYSDEPGKAKLSEKNLEYLKLLCHVH